MKPQSHVENVWQGGIKGKVCLLLVEDRRMVGIVGEEACLPDRPKLVLRVASPSSFGYYILGFGMACVLGLSYDGVLIGHISDLLICSNRIART